MDGAQPDPADQAGWSVYGKLTNENLRFLWGVLDEASKIGAKRTAVQQKIGDYFAAAMNEPAIEKLGATPLQPLLAQIAAIKSKKDLAAFLAKEQPRTYGSGWVFGFGAIRISATPRSSSLSPAPAASAFRPRNYYIKDDERSKGIREKYIAHIQNMLELIGEPKLEAAADTRAAMKSRPIWRRRRSHASNAATRTTYTTRCPPPNWRS